MGTMTILRSRYPRLTRRLKRPTDLLGRIGDHMLFYLRALGGVPHAAIHFRREIIRLIAEISMGAGTLAMIGGTVVIVGFLTLAAGGTLAVQGYSSLGNIGIEALTGFLAAFINVRISAPVVAGIGLAATFGAGVTAQLGAMRINEEIDALESMAIRPVEYLVSTRIVAGMIAITPLYSIAVILSFVASQFHGGALRAVRWPVRPLLQHLPEPDRLVMVVPAGGADGDHDPIDTHLFRILCLGRAVRCRGCGRQRRAHLAGRGRVGHPAGVAVHLWFPRQLQPVGVASSR